MYQVKIYNKISEIDKKCWDELAADNIFLSYPWLKTYEEVTVNPPVPHYITLHDNKKIIAASVCYFDKKENSSSIDKILLGRLIDFKWIKSLTFLPAIVCGSKNGYGSHFLFSKELNENETILHYKRLIDIIENIAEEYNASVYFSNVMRNEKSLTQILTKRGYYKTYSLPLNYIDIIWSSFDDYKKSISKEHSSMKKTVSREVNENRKAGIEIKELQDFENNWERLYELLKMNHGKHNTNSFTLKQDYILQLKKNFGSDAVFFTALKGEDIIGVCIELKKNNNAALTRVGIDHEISKNDLTHFNIAFYEPIKKAIEAGIEKIFYGNAFYEMKKRRGFKAADTYIYYKPNYGYFNYFIKFWFVIHKLWMKRKFSFTRKNQNKG